MHIMTRRPAGPAARTRRGAAGTSAALKTLLTAGLLGLAATAVAQDQNFNRLAPEPVTPLAPPGSGSGLLPPAGIVGPVSTEAIVEKLKGIVLLGSGDAVLSAPAAPGIDAARVPFAHGNRIADKLGAFLDKPLSQSSIQAMVALIGNFYAEHGRPFVVVSVPEQDVTGGVVQLMVSEARVGQVGITGNRWFGDDSYFNALRVRSGDPVLVENIDKGIARINRNPFRAARVEASPGSAPGTTDLQIVAQERFPLSVYGAYDNTGTETLGETRLSAGFNWGSVFGSDHQLGYRFITGSDPDKFKAHSLTYDMPGRSGRNLLLFASHADSASDIDVDLGQEGTDTNAGVRYDIPLANRGDYRHGLILGSDFKRTDSDLLFGGDTFFGSSTEVFDVSLGYRGTRPDAHGSSGFEATLLYSPGDVTDRNDDEAFESARAFADSEYIIGRLSGERVTRLPKGFAFVATGEAQWTDTNLLATEQVSIGGAHTVRGYRELEARGDEGYLISIEALTPVFSPATNDRLYFLAFVDYGWVSNKNLLPDEEDHVSLAGAGLGVRYNWGDHVTIGIDWGQALRDGSRTESGDDRLHGNLLIRY